MSEDLYYAYKCIFAEVVLKNFMMDVLQLFVENS